MTKYIFIYCNDKIGINNHIIIASFLSLYSTKNILIKYIKDEEEHFERSTLFVNSDGSEIEQSMGCYERIAGIKLGKNKDKNDISVYIFTNRERMNNMILSINNKVTTILVTNKISSDFEYNLIINKSKFKKINNIYNLPYYFHKQNYHKILSQKINKIYKIPVFKSKFRVNIMVNHSKKSTYLSIQEALKHAAYYLNKDVSIKWIDVDCTKKEFINKLLKIKGGIIVPGGYGKDGFNNKLLAIKYARENNIPFLGICYGMQLAVIEYCRNVLNITDATTEEINNDNKNKNVIINSGKFRLGQDKGMIKDNTLAEKIYNSNKFTGRYRHKYIVNKKYERKLIENGLIISGYSHNNKIIEIIEYPINKFFIGVQFHPELDTYILKPNVLFVSFLNIFL